MILIYLVLYDQLLSNYLNKKLYKHCTGIYNNLNCIIGTYLL